jgi:ADP-heptose:LPS heptosyltransferase
MDAAWREEGRGRLSGRGTRCVLLHPGSGARRKNWPAERFAELAGLIESRLAATPALLFGEADEHVRGVLRRIAPAVQELPPLGLADLASCLAAAEGYVGNDSGITHLAAAAGVRGVALFGPTDPAVWGPREGHAVRVLRANPPTAEGLAELPVRAVFEALAQRIGVQDP